MVPGVYWGPWNVSLMDKGELQDHRVCVLIMTGMPDPGILMGGGQGCCARTVWDNEKRILPST